MFAKFAWKIAIVALALICCTQNLTAEDFYVSPTGSNSNPGTASQPFLTIQRATNVMEAGDVCHIGEGRYCETIRPKPVTNPVFDGPSLTYQAWGNPRPRIIAGKELNVEWTVAWGDVWKATVPPSFFEGTSIESTGRFVQMFIDDQAMVEARWPNINHEAELVHMHRGTAKAGTDRLHLVDANLPHGDFSDALVHICLLYTSDAADE